MDFAALRSTSLDAPALGGPVPIDRIRNAAPTRVGILEIDPTGHRLVYVRHLHDASEDDGCVLFTPIDPAKDEDFGAHFSGTAVHSVPVRAGSRRRALADALNRAGEWGVERFVIPDGDPYVVPLLALLLERRLRRLPRPPSIRLMILRSSSLGGPEPATAAMVVKPVAVALLGRLRGVGVHFLTDALGVVEHRRGFPGVRGVRDPVDTRAGVDAAGTVDPPAWVPAAAKDRVRVGLLGVISARKNLPLLLDALMLDPGLVLLVAGRLDARVTDDLRADPRTDRLRADGRLVVVDRLLDHDEFSAALAGVDVVAVLHDNDAPSGILAEACARATPAVVPAGAWLARVVESSGIGRATALTPYEVADALRAAHEGRDAHVGAIHRWRPRLGTGDFTTTLLAWA